MDTILRATNKNINTTLHLKGVKDAAGLDPAKMTEIRETTDKITTMPCNQSYSKRGIEQQ